ncbi:MAG: C40 family peptidase [Patescibacteria group bacterium]
MDNREKISKLIEIAKGLIGTPYKYGAYLEQNNGALAFDCSSFVQHVFKQIEIELPRSSVLQAVAPGQEIKNLELAKPADLIFFEGNRGHYRHDLFPNRKIYIGHLGIYLGNDEIIHATNNSSASGVVIQKISELQKEFPEAYKIVMIKRFI